MNTLRPRRSGVDIRCDDPSQTPAAGLMLVAETADKLDMIATLDRHIGPIKQRRRGHSGGQLVMAWAEMMLAGGDFMSDLDNVRADEAGAALRTVAEVPAATTAAQLARRFAAPQLAGIEKGLAEITARALKLLPKRTRCQLMATRPTLDFDPTDVQVYGRQKERVGWNYAGQRCGRPYLVTWAEAGVAVAAELLAGDDDPRPVTPALVARAVAALPPGLGRPRIRADAGLFDGKIAWATLKAGADFAIAAKRNPAIWRAVRAPPEDAWAPAQGMAGAQVAEITYAPVGWPPGTRAIARRVRVSAEAISADPRSRRRRTIDPHQLRLVLDGLADEAYAYSVIVTNLEGAAVEIEAWFRLRAQIEERIKDSKLGMALRHLPSGYAAVNAVWMWAALVALTCSALLQALAGTDYDGRVHGKRLRRELICVPGRLVRHARRTILRTAPGFGYLKVVYARLRVLPVPT